MEHIYGPYRNRSAWRIVIVGSDGARIAHTRPSREEAEALAHAIRRKAALNTVERSVSEYLGWMAECGRQPRTVETTALRLRTLHDQVMHLPVAELSTKRCQLLYVGYAEGRAADTHRNALSQARTWGGWCVKRGYLARNPWSEVEGLGRRRAGKRQLRVDDAQRLAVTALDRAPHDDGALATLLALLLGLRASEIVGIATTDIDAGGRLLWINSGKTEHSARRLEVPPLLAELLADWSAVTTSPRLLPYRRWWVRESVHRLCRLAGVTPCTAHSLRGLHATLAVGAGVSSHAVAAALGHASFDITQRHYLAPGSTTPAAAALLFPALSPAEKAPCK